MCIRDRDWMRENPVSVAPDATLATARELMSENEVRRLPVVERGELIGILTNSDILRQIPSTADESDDDTRLLLTQRTVREVMTYSPMTINPSATIQEAAERMLEYQVSGLPAVSYTHLRAHETVLDLVCRLLLEKKKK